MVPVRNISNKSIVAVIVAVVGIITAVGFWLLSIAGAKAEPKIEPGPISTSGTMVCLPHKDTSGPQTMECAYGLKDAEGQYFGLHGLDQEKLMDGTVTINKHVTVSGDVTLPSANEKYGIVGNIDISSIVPVN